MTPDTLGLRLGEAKDLLCAVQETVVDAQVKGTLAAQAACPQESPRRTTRRGGPPPAGRPRRGGCRRPARLKWFSWHGNAVRAPYTISDLETDAEVADPSPGQAKFLTTLREFDTYIRANAGSIPNYGERRRADEVISSSIAESAVNQVISKRMV